MSTLLLLSVIALGWLLLALTLGVIIGRTLASGSTSERPRRGAVRESRGCRHSRSATSASSGSAERCSTSACRG